MDPTNADDTELLKDLMLEAIIKAYKEAVEETDREAALALVERAVADGIRAEDIIFKVVIPAIEESMASVTQDPDANLAQHFMTAQIAADVTERMLERFERPPEIVGRIVIGTATGDLHSLGKRIVSGCLKAMMVKVVDLGINVPAERFVDAAVTHDAQIIAVSAMMHHTAVGEDGARGVRRILHERSLEDRIRLVVGGAPYRFDCELCKAVGADGWAPDGFSAARMIVDMLRPHSVA
jgi:trimethylamine corrinoid protein